ncbi:flagellar hook-basal body complex protein FliE [Solimonas sp. SE-A11]|uniref:flagellar hook-basal body complex protein FliE n=1 Tax=Solimonas sp. SE-A11 TaxID=3054954 RepID=UPI00259C99FB|nr:flagellar hook-basal body complex protein FliE [Solimonas sp. SE-A11]MDM4770800.1 flagellar hook-basal body complex protein FliE [Solimonas sp. SE-A11]
MNEIGINNVLSQIRAMQAQTAQRPAGVAAAQPVAQKAGFDSVLKSAVESVNQAQQDSSRLQTAFAMGDKSVDLASVMVAGAKSQVQFKGMVEVRNRLVSAYQDIMNMPI